MFSKLSLNLRSLARKQAVSNITVYPYTLVREKLKDIRGYKSDTRALRGVKVRIGYQLFDVTKVAVPVGSTLLFMSR